nr:immunoglobulin light chain junction region [Macaca mulatta]MOX53423.1 immunoglobulin light chain junction region [Macaca mulatta]
CQQHNTYPHSF